MSISSQIGGLNFSLACQEWNGLKNEDFENFNHFENSGHFLKKENKLEKRRAENQKRREKRKK